MSEILEVDMATYENGSSESKKALYDGVYRSLTETAFILIKHDLPDGLIDEAYQALEGFYSLSPEEKMGYFRPDANGQTGYVGIGVETAAGLETRDYKEMLNFSTELPKGHPFKKKYPISYPDQVIPGHLKNTLFTFHDSMTNLQKRFLRVIAQSFGAHESFFDAAVKNGPTLTRSLRYPPLSEAPADGREYVLAGEHYDINLTTVLPKATKRGLQVKLDGEWQDVIAPDGYVILNTGLMMRVFTNNLIGGGLHRVVGDKDATDSRYSCVQFLHPTPATILSPLNACVTNENPQRFPGIAADDALSEVLFNIGLIPAVDEEDPHAGGM